jgi:hypothetical protein
MTLEHCLENLTLGQVETHFYEGRISADVFEGYMSAWSLNHSYSSIARRWRP